MCGSCMFAVCAQRAFSRPGKLLLLASILCSHLQAVHSAEKYAKLAPSW